MQELAEKSKVASMLTLHLKNEKTLVQYLSHRYDEESRSGKEYYKRRILQSNFKQEEVDLDDPESQHVLKALFATSFAIESFNNLREFQRIDAEKILNGYLERYKDLRQGKLPSSWEQREVQEEEKIEEREEEGSRINVEYEELHQNNFEMLI